MDLSALLQLAHQLPEPLANLLVLLLVGAVARTDRQLDDARRRLAVLEALVGGMRGGGGLDRRDPAQVRPAA